MFSAPLVRLTILAVTLGLACSGSDGTPLSSPRSFLVQGKLTLQPSEGPDRGSYTPMVPARHDFTLHLDPTALTLILGTKGSAAGAAVRSGDRITFETTAPLDETWLPGQSDCEAARVVYEQLTLIVRADRVEGTARGKVISTNGHAEVTLDAVLTFSGGPDDVPPSIGGDLAGVHPLADLFIAASEPLARGTTARLTGPSGTLPELALQPSVDGEAGGAIIGFRKPAGTALVPGATYEVVLGGPRSDLAGNAFAPGNIRLTTEPVLPVLGANNFGFEDATATVGGARVVDASSLPPIAGLRSLSLWSSRWTVGLQVPALASKLLLKARPVSSTTSWSPGRVAILVAAPGGPITRPGAIDWGGPLARQAVPGGELFLGEIRTVEVPLPPAHGAEVILDISVDLAGSDCGPPTMDGMGLLIDDLRAE